MVKLHITDHDITIIGGGISGFYVAEQLKRKHKKLNICLYEKSSRIGGRINSINTNRHIRFYITIHTYFWVFYLIYKSNIWSFSSFFYVNQYSEMSNKN